MQPSAERKAGVSKSGLIGVIALSFALALIVPAMARDAQRVGGRTHGAETNAPAFSYERNLPVEDALRWGYGQGYSYYPSGFGGLYGDGRHPDNVISNYRP